MDRKLLKKVLSVNRKKKFEGSNSNKLFVSLDIIIIEYLGFIKKLIFVLIVGTVNKSAKAFEER